MMRTEKPVDVERTVPDSNDRLRQLRVEIEEIDEALMDLIVRRVSVGATIGRAKTAAGLAICDPAREAEVVKHAGARARTAGLDEEGVRQLYWALVALSRRSQLDQP